MTLNTYTPLKVLITLICLILSFSCSKDSDLFDEDVLADSEADIENRTNESDNPDTEENTTNPDTENSGQDFSESLKAFPTAQGGGSDITGGRGGAVIHVTNLNNNGTGSLRAALTTKGTRTIVFDVSGIITLTSEVTLDPSHSNLTVAGQTAPRGGITIAGDPINFAGADNMIWRYVRRRNGQYTGVSDVLEHNGFRGYLTNAIFDHVSLSFNDDQAISFSNRYGPSTDITIQRCLFGENGTNIIIGYHGDYDCGDLSFIANLFSNSPHRTPNIGANGRVDIINQVTWNSSFREININGRKNVSPKLNYIGNYIEEGPQSGNQINLRQIGSPRIYSAHNYHSRLYKIPQLEDWALWSDRGLNLKNPPSLDHSYFTTTKHPFLENTNTPMSAQEAYNSVINNVGANRYLDNTGTPQEYLDSYDSDRINDAVNQVSKNAYNKSWTQPTIPENIRPSTFDTDNDGMADAWEISQFGNLNQSATEDFDGDGYENIEEYMNQVDFN